MVKSAVAGCDGFYLAARGGVAKYDVSDDRSNTPGKGSDYVIDKKRFMASGALGYRYKHFRTELEYVWRRKNTEVIAGVTKGQFRSESYMFVVYYDFFPYTWFTPYINAGAGYTKSRLNTDIYAGANPLFHYKKDDRNFTWSLGAGISAKITNRLNFDIGYRYYDMGDFSMLNGKTDMEDHEVYAGFRYVL